MKIEMDANSLTHCIKSQFHYIFNILTLVDTELPFVRHSSWISTFYIQTFNTVFEFYVT